MTVMSNYKPSNYMHKLAHVFERSRSGITYPVMKPAS